MMMLQGGWKMCSDECNFFAQATSLAEKERKPCKIKISSAEH